MRTLLSVLFIAGLAACQSETGSYSNSLTGETCQPNGTLVPMPPAHGNGGHNSPTGIPGDNIDDPHSGKVDCYYDGNSGQGDDKKHPCDPGCDDQHCCVEDPDGDPGDDGGGEPGVDAGTEVPNPS